MIWYLGEQQSRDVASVQEERCQKKREEQEDGVLFKNKRDLKEIIDFSFPSDSPHVTSWRLSVREDGLGQAGSAPCGWRCWHRAGDGTWAALAGAAEFVHFF